MNPMRRMRMPGALVCLLAVVGFTACDGGDTSGLPPSGHDPSLVRVENASESVMSDVTVYLPEDEILTAASLGPGERTAYREVPTAYRIATVAGRLDGEPFAIQVIDYVGEEPLGDGRFTYVLDVFDPNSTEPSVTLTVRED